MSILHNRKQLQNTGFDTKGNTGGRLLNKNGKPNVIKKNIPFFERYSAFHILLDMPTKKFITLGITIFILINILFSCIYYLIGIDQLSGLVLQINNPLYQFGEAFFFSAQTLTTVGYGRVSPATMTANSVAAFESFIGVISFAVLTGLIYGRFSKPRAFIDFSKNIIIAPHKEEKAIMCRLVHTRVESYSEVEAKLTIAMLENADSTDNFQFFAADLELESIKIMSLSWTLVHVLNEKSPLYGFTAQEYIDKKVEFIYFITAYDEFFSNKVIKRYSYTNQELINGAKFNPMFSRTTDNNATYLDYSKLNSFDKLV